MGKCNSFMSVYLRVGLGYRKESKSQWAHAVVLQLQCCPTYILAL